MTSKFSKYQCPIAYWLAKNISLKNHVNLLKSKNNQDQKLITDLKVFFRQKNLITHHKNYSKVIQHQNFKTNFNNSKHQNNLSCLKNQSIFIRSPKEFVSLFCNFYHRLFYLVKNQTRNVGNKLIQNNDHKKNIFKKRLINLYSYFSQLFKKSNLSSFTIIELLIVITLISIIATISIILFDPKKQIEKSWDAKRKKELNTLQKIFEEYNNDNNCYPKPENVAYQLISKNEGYICGSQKNSPQLIAYLPNLPCDPQFPLKKYLYQVDNDLCPFSYRIYAVLSESSNQNTNQYNYGVVGGNTDLYPYPTFSHLPNTPTLLPPSSTITLPTLTTIPTTTIFLCPNDPSNKFCLKENLCNSCGTFEQCQLESACDKPLKLFSDSFCLNQCYKN